MAIDNIAANENLRTEITKSDLQTVNNANIKKFNAVLEGAKAQPYAKDSVNISPISQKIILSDEEMATKLVSNKKDWGQWEQNSTVTYELGDMSEKRKNQTRESFEKWNELINLNIKEIDANSKQPPDIFFNIGKPANNALGHTKKVVFSYDYVNEKGEKLENIEKPEDVTQYYIVISDKMKETKEKDDPTNFITSHEIGHPLKLDHLENNASKNNKVKDTRIFANDTFQNTVMSYYSPIFEKNTGDFGSSYPSGPMLFDVLAAQKLYGANKNTRTGNDEYIFSPELVKEQTSYFADKNNNPIGSLTISEHYDARDNDPNTAVMTIYDADGEDMINASNFDSRLLPAKISAIRNGEVRGRTITRDPVDQVISLKPGTFSSIGYLKQNVAVAFNYPNEKAIIEHAISADGNDILIGNFANNYFEAREGDDVIDFTSGGNDIAWDGLGNDYYVLDDAKDSNEPDDILVFNYDETKSNKFGADEVYFFNPDADEIFIAGSTKEHEVYLKQMNNDTLVDYGSGSILLKNVKANEAKNAFKTTTPVVKNSSWSMLPPNNNHLNNYLNNDWILELAAPDYTIYNDRTKSSYNDSFNFSTIFNS